MLCVASVADQGVDVEHIIQDAGSKGDIKTLVAERQNARLFVERDEGMYDAINRGLRRATGEICAYLNCDEQYLPGALGQVAEFFNRRPDIDVLFGDLIVTDTTGRPLSYRRTVLPTRNHVRFVHLNTATCATFFRRKLLDRGFYFDPQWKVIGDAVWIDKLLNNGVPMTTIHAPLSAFAFTGQNLGATADARSEGERWKALSGGSCAQTIAAVLWHRLRKALAGAYVYRDVDVAIYTADSNSQRRLRRAKRVGFGWPT